MRQLPATTQIVHQHAARERVYMCTCNRSDGNSKKLMWDDDSSPALWSKSKLLVQGTGSIFLLAGLLVLVKINQRGSSTNMWCSNVLSSEPQHSYWHWESCLHLHPAHMPRNYSDSLSLKMVQQLIPLKYAMLMIQESEMAIQ